MIKLYCIIQRLLDEMKYNKGNKIFTDLFYRCVAARSVAIWTASWQAKEKVLATELKGTY